MDDVQAMLDRIGADEAGRLLAQALTAESQTRLSKLAASLAVIDRHLPVGRVKRSVLSSRRHVWVGQVPNGDSARSALLASLIDSVLGGDPEGLRTRLFVVSAWWEGAVAADLDGLSKSDRRTETSAARRVLQRVIQLLLNELQSR